MDMAYPCSSSATDILWTGTGRAPGGVGDGSEAPMTDEWDCAYGSWAPGRGVWPAAASLATDADCGLGGTDVNILMVANRWSSFALAWSICS